MKKYPTYKDFGIQWIGETPEHWEINRLKNVLSLNDETLGENTPNNLVIRYVEISDVNQELGIRNSTLMPFAEAPSRARRKVRSGDIIVSTVRTYLRAIARVDECPDNLIVSTGFAVLRPKNIDSRFLGYLMISDGIINEIISKSTGVSYPAINASQLIKIQFPVPSTSEQTFIATFLDQKTSEIDQLITSKVELIQKLESQRKAIINEAVTGQAYKTGLIPSPDGKEVNYKDSGVEWLGEIPEHWRFTPLKFISYMKGRIGWQGLKSDEFIEEGPFLITGMNFKNGKIRWDEVYHITEERYYEAPEIQLKGGDILMTKDGTIGKLLFIDDIPFPGKASLNSHLLVLRPLNDKYYPKYLYYLLDSFIFKRHIELTKTGTTFFGITQESVGNFITLLPEVSQQIAIVKFLDTKLETFDVTINAVTESIGKLKQYKQSLISEVVTGKIDVRNWQKD